MKRMYLVAAIAAVCAAPAVSDAQASKGPSYGDALMIVYDGSNHGSIPFKCEAGDTYTYSTVGDKHAFTGSPTLNFSFYGPGGPYMGWYPITQVPLTGIEAIPMGGTATYHGNCADYAVTKNYGYSVVGATYNYTLSVHVYVLCP